MGDGSVSMRQLLAILFAALLSPAVRVLPGQTAAIAGEAGWLSTLLALPALLLLCWVIFALLRPAEEGAGLGTIFQRVLGKWGGKALTALYLLWGLFLLGANARLFGLRFLATSYRNAPLPLFIVASLAVSLWLARKKLPAFARAGQIFYLALALGLGFALILGALNVEPGNFLPIWTEDAPGALRATLPALSVLGYVVFAAFPGQVERRADNRRRSMKWAAVLCLALTAMQVVCLGNFGPGLTARMDMPFFMMVKGIGVPGAFERVESIVIALWALSDLALMTLMTVSCCAMAKSIFPIQQRKSAALPVVVLALLGALFLFPDAFALSELMELASGWGNLALGFGAPILVLLIGKVRRVL